MKHIFLDTNFVMDYLLRDEYKACSQEFLAYAAKRKCKFYISYLTVANFAYILRKLDKSQLYILLQKLSDLFIIVENTGGQIQDAIKLQADDFEDALQYVAAKDNGCECIITRNIKDFYFSDIPVMDCTDFMHKYP